MLCAISLLFVAAAGPNLLTDPSFEDGLAHWEQAGSPARVDSVQVDGRSAARIVVPDGASVAWPSIAQRVPVAPGDLLEGAADVLARDIHDGFGAYLAVEFHDAAGQRLSFGQSRGLRPEPEWNALSVRAVAPEHAVSARLCLILNGRGEAQFDNARLMRLGNVLPEPLEGDVQITVTAEIVCDRLVGFGAEDDGWFYAPENLDRGIGADDIALREKRIAWLDPDWIRMFFWYKDWNPSGDWTTFTFDSPNMQSHCRTLALYQRIGAAVNVTGVEWGVSDPFGHPAEMAAAIGALLEHLIKERGFTCVRQWTLTNEPNSHFVQLGYPFERYVELHRLVKAECARRGLDVKITGSDDTGGFEWFQACVSNDAYFEAADLFASHRYFPYADRILAPYFFEDRLNALAERPPAKPFVVAELGFQDHRSGTFANPIMEDYPYALWTCAFILDGLNRGVAGFSIWCMHEVYYPGGSLMNYGLWNYRDRGWGIRPVYHALGCFTRMTEAGDPVRKSVSSHPAHASAAVVRDVVFWVNQADREVPLVFSAALAGPATAYTRDTVTADDSLGMEVPVRQNRFVAPPQSFGYLRLEN